MSFPGTSRSAAGAGALPPDLAFLLAEGVDPARLLSAAALARASGTDAASALLRSGSMAEEPYYEALARALGLPYLARPNALGPGARFPESLAARAAPLAGAPGRLVRAPEGAEIEGLLTGRLSLDRTAGLTAPSRLRNAVFAALPHAVAAHAAEALERNRPDWAYRPGLSGRQAAALGLTACAGGLILSGLPPGLSLAAVAAAQSGILATASFRLGSLFLAAPVEPAPGSVAALSDRDLPVYTVLVALYREAAVVPRLVGALARLDYPAAKLDIKFVLEADDAETAAALAAVPLPARFEVIVAPPGAPRTKPRALNVALPLARGECLVVYDAEDVPDPGQLRLAAALFRREPPETACLQGRLVVDNADDSWLSRCFALEYAGLFDVLGPGLANWRLPTPLGGTSTHFRTAVLRALHGWDAWNVTEDADLGLRLALAGYMVGDLPSATYEEAPAHLGPWLRQRVRWMKGFVQTTVTHARHPLRTLRRLGPLDAFCALTMVPGTVASALVYPFLTGAAALAFLWHGPEGGPAFWPNLPQGLALTIFGAGLAAMMLPAALGAVRRGWYDLLPFVLLLPVYYMLISLAAWLGLVELARAPAHWNKTEHGLFRTSRTGALRRRVRRP
ncbi:cellulose synthase/poly-beta-1,6-N-acetylglucosamine synthase-like glycosyltransferase [Methylobacterium sp. BE186]|uniref:glycosyltransferase family 2 protein n=1 Tax=Methylobacterium sp. BE186 TaxID=2817715 RepID=UPI002858BC49|nr:glycosyltransferase family 2 protein [Methylobacterium sp. BE186]MDR7039077.1 cellulose synthase/poly-beta-1,6-N-acetylglucosamine synthase-like glycosyltransferase [Methylobacterium sp. BE186]